MNNPPKTGCCYCGCGERVAEYFKQGHDRSAEARIIKAVYGSTAAFVAFHGYGPRLPGERA